MQRRCIALVGCACQPQVNLLTSRVIHSLCACIIICKCQCLQGNLMLIPHQRWFDQGWIGPAWCTDMSVCVWESHRQVLPVSFVLWFSTFVDDMQFAFVVQCRHNIAIVDSISVSVMHFPFVNLNVGTTSINTYNAMWQVILNSELSRSMSAQHCICRFDQCVNDAICICRSQCRHNIDQQIQCYVTP
jgi:hypothetical protein